MVTVVEIVLLVLGVLTLVVALAALAIVLADRRAERGRRTDSSDWDPADTGAFRRVNRR